METETINEVDPVAQKLSDTQERIRAIVSQEVKAALWSEGPQILRAELKRFFKPLKDALKFWNSQEKE